jgi:hypothetical protein
VTWLGFIASLVQSLVALVQALAWPLVVVVLAILFRPQLQRLLSVPMQRLKAGPFEVVFDHKLAETEARIAPASPPLPLATPSVREELTSVALESPGLAVLEGHERIYRRLLELVGPGAAIPIPGPLPRTGLAIAKVATDRGLILPETAQAIEELTELRNLVAHGGLDAITADGALRYLGLVDRVLYLMSTPPPKAK